MKPLVAITGASSGIGKAAAEIFSRNGHPLLLMARRLEKIIALDLPDSICKKVDVTDFDTIHGAVQSARKKFGPVDCMINNAGIMKLGTPWHQEINEWQAMIDVNMMGVLNGIRSVLDGMIERNTGTIINVSSLAGRKTFQKHAVYCATKFGVHAFSEVIREEVSPYNVRVITIAPGAVETELITHTTSEKLQQDWWDGLGGILKPEDVARTILFAYQQPQSVCLREILVNPTGQSG